MKAGNLLKLKNIQMKLGYCVILSGLLELASSCTEKIELTGGTPDFQVKTTATTFKTGENVTFSFDGNAGLISFYSGEVFHDYAYKEGRIVTAGQVSLSFTTSVTGGTQSNQLSVVASSNFDGNYADFARVQAATWVDITSRFLLGTSATFLASGSKDITDLVIADKPLYIAYKYVTKPQLVSGDARTWMVQSFSMTSNTSIGLLTLTDMLNAGFRIVKQINDSTIVSRSSITATRVTLLGNAYVAGKDPLHEIWAISKLINAGEIDMGPDLPVPIKGNADTRLESYTYKFTKPGTYKVYFIASNVNINESREVIRQIDITITP